MRYECLACGFYVEFFERHECALGLTPEWCGFYQPLSESDMSCEESSPEEIYDDLYSD